MSQKRQEHSDGGRNTALGLPCWAVLWVQMALICGCKPVHHSLGVLPESADPSPSDGGAISPTGGRVTPTGGRVTQSGGVQVATGGGSETGGNPVGGGSQGTGGEPATCDLIDAEPGRAQVIIVQDSAFVAPPGLAWPFLNPIPEGIVAYGWDQRSSGSQVALHVTRACGRSKADVPLGRLPENADALSRSVSGAVNFADPHGAISSALEDIQEAIATVPPLDLDRFGIVVVTDGFPGGDCTGAIGDIVAAGPASSPPVNVYIVELTYATSGVTDWVTGASASADELAVAGGTGTAIPAEMIFQPSPATQVNNALQEARSQIQPCDIAISRGDDPSQLLIEVGGQVLAEVRSKDACSEAGGYFLRTPGNLLRGVTLCETSCETVRNEGLEALIVASNCD